MKVKYASLLLRVVRQGAAGLLGLELASSFRIVEVARGRRPSTVGTASAGVASCEAIHTSCSTMLEIVILTDSAIQVRINHF